MKKRMEKPSSMNRRMFLKTLAASGAAGACGSLLAGCGPTAVPSSGAVGSSGLTLDLTLPENQPLASVGGTLALEANALDSKGMLLVRSGENSFRAFSRNCTHQGCTIGGFSDGISSCPCHGSQFDAGGAVVKGPAQKPLKEYATALSGTTLTVHA